MLGGIITVTGNGLSRRNNLITRKKELKLDTLMLLILTIWGVT